MSLSHCWLSELLAERDELHPLLDLLKDADVGVALLVDFHALESSLELFDLFVHGAGVGLLPRVGHVALEGLLAAIDVAMYLRCARREILEMRSPSNCEHKSLLIL